MKASSLLLKNYLIKESTRLGLGSPEFTLCIGLIQAGYLIFSEESEFQNKRKHKCRYFSKYFQVFMGHIVLLNCNFMGKI